MFLLKYFFYGIPYTAYGALTFDFCLVFVLILGLEPPAGARIRKIRKFRNKGGGGVICAPRAQHRRVPNL